MSSRRTRLDTVWNCEFICQLNVFKIELRFCFPLSTQVQSVSIVNNTASEVLIFVAVEKWEFMILIKIDSNDQMRYFSSLFLIMSKVEYRQLRFWSSLSSLCLPVVDSASNFDNIDKCRLQAEVHKPPRSTVSHTSAVTSHCFVLRNLPSRSYEPSYIVC